MQPENPDAGTKVCSACRVRKPRDTDYSPAQLKKQGQAKCKACVSQAMEDENAAAAAAPVPQPAAAPAAAGAPRPAAAAVAEPVLLRHLPAQRGPRPRDQSAERRAQSLLFDAFELPAFSPQREQMMESALQICPDLPDALLAKCDRWIHKPGERDAARALPLIEHALTAAADRLGSDYIRDTAPNLYTAVSFKDRTSDSARPFLRALYAYSRALWSVGRRDEAVAYAKSVACSGHCSSLDRVAQCAVCC